MKHSNTIYKQRNWSEIKELVDNGLKIDYEEKQNGVYRVFVTRGNSQFFCNLFPSDFGTVVGASDTNDADYVDFVSNYKETPDNTPPATITHALDPDTGDPVPVWNQRTTGDGKTRVLASHKPIIAGKEAYNFFSSAGDIEDGTMGEGSMFLLDVVSGTTSSGTDLHFSHDLDPMESIYVFGGGVAWENAGWGDNVELQIRSTPTSVVPRVVATGLGLDVDYSLDGDRIYYAGDDLGDYALGGYPKFVPNYSNTGYWNLDKQNLIPVPASGTGVFDWFTTDQYVGSYVKNLLVYGTNYNYVLIDGTESAPLPYGAYFRILAHNVSDTDWRFWGLMKMYRQRLK